MAKKTRDQVADFRMTALDREILLRCEYDLDLWMHGYFHGEALPYQQYFYHQPQKNKLLVAGIRTGKSHLVSMAALHFAQYHPGSFFLNTSLSSEQSKIVYQNCLTYCHMPNFSHWISHIQSSPFPEIHLVNGSKLFFKSIGYDAELIRGFEYDFINVDEAAYIVRESAIKTLRGRLLGVNKITGAHREGIFWMVSSPKGQGWMYDRWKKGDPKYSFAQPQKYLSLRVRTLDNTKLRIEDIQDLMADYTDQMIRQEIFGEFLDNLDAMFPYQLVMEACDAEDYHLQVLHREIKRWYDTNTEQPSLRETTDFTEDLQYYELDPEAGHFYINSWDFGKKATPNGRNAMVGMVYDITHSPWKQVAYRYAENQGYVWAKAEAERWHAKYSRRGSKCKTGIDSTGKGDVVEEFMRDERTIDDLTGLVYTNISKPPMLHAGKLALEHGNVRFPFIRRVVDQLSNYVINDKEIAQDNVMAFCQAMWMARKELNFVDESEQASSRLLVNTYGRRDYMARHDPRYVEARLARHGAQRSTLGTRGQRRATVSYPGQPSRARRR